MRKIQIKKQTKKMRSLAKRLSSLILCIILIFTWEMPVLAENLSELDRRLQVQKETEKQEAERAAWEETVFEAKEGITLSQNAPDDRNKNENQTITEKEQSPEKAEDSVLYGKSLRMPEADENTSPELLYGEPAETGKNYKTFRLPDGTYKTIFTSYANTYTENGKEKPIDNTLVSENSMSGESYTNKENDIDITFSTKDRKEASVSISGNEIEAVLEPAEGDYGRPAVSENAIRYNGVFENIDIQYTIQPNGMKQDIILMAPQERTEFVYLLKKDGIQAEIHNNCIYLYDSEEMVSGNEMTDSHDQVSGNNITNEHNHVSGNDMTAAGKAEPSIIISAPRMQDAAGISSDNLALAMEETEEGYEITLTADREWLQSQKRSYPIKIDPSFTVLKGEIDNLTVSSLGGVDRENIYSFSGYFDGLGKARSYVLGSFLYQSINDFKKVDVLSAKINIYQVNDSTGFDLGCYRMADALYHANITWENSIIIDRYIAGEDAVSPAGQGWHSFDIRDSANGWINGIYESHGLVLIASDETQPGAVFATENYPDAAYAPTLVIEWQPAGDVPIDYSLDDTTIHLRPMTLTSTDGKMQCYGVFADGVAKPYAFLNYALSDTTKNYHGLLLTGNEKIYPNSSAFEAAFPAGILRYKDVKSNWQTAYPFTDFEYNRLYSMNAQASYRDKMGKKVTSDEFLIYPVSRYDTMQKIADYYGVPLETLLFDNKGADMLLVENNTLFIRNPKQNKDTPYQPSELTDQEKAQIDSALLGRARHCEFGFEPVNLNTGNFYLAQEDFSYSDSLGTFALTRSYNSLNATRAGSFGRGFTSLFDESISALSDGSLVYNREDGSSLTFTQKGNNTYHAPEGYDLELVREVTGTATAEFSAGEQSYQTYRYVVTREDDSRRIFDGGGNLIETRGEDGEILTLHRDLSGKLTGITREGVTMGITTTPEGFISTITMPNGGTFCYGYDSSQNLATVTDPLGGVKRFSYDENHRMSAWYDENGTRVVLNTYDTKGRVIRQTNETGGQIILRYENGKTTATDAAGNQTTYEYDKDCQTTAIRYPDGTALYREYRDHELVKETDRGGVETRFTYDENGNIVKKETGEITTTYEYDTRENLTAITDAGGNTFHAEYDQNNNLIHTTDEEGNIISYAYDSHNRLTRKTDANRNTETYNYTGNYLTEIRTNGRVTDRFTYNALGNIKSHTDGAGNTTTYEYDILGRNILVRTPEGNKTSITYGKTGLVQSVTDAAGGTTTYTYDKGNNILSMTDALGGTYEYTYDANENRLTEKDPEGNRTAYSYDEMDRLIKAVDGMGGIYTYEYDDHDNVISSTDPLGNRMSAVYDPYHGLPLSSVNEEGIRTDYEYDTCGNLLSVTKDGTLLAACEYDARGQLTGTELANGLKEIQKYDGNGNCILRTDGKGRTLAFEYDDENRLIKETTAEGNEYHYAYDGAGNLTSCADPLGNRETYTYDGEGNILTKTDGEGNTTAYEYDRTGNLITETLPDGICYHYTYDLLGRLTASADGRDYVTTYTYDKTGNLTEITDALGQMTTYEYDALSRNTRTVDVMGRETACTYDAKGNLLTETAPDGGVTSYDYDKCGRLTQTTDPLSHSTLYEYDAFDRITKKTDPLGGITGYEYDKTGNLLAETDPLGVKTAYEYDLYGNILSETDARGSRTEYAYDLENRLTTVTDAKGNKAELSYDGTGNLTSVKDPLGAAESYTYDKAGRLTAVKAADGGTTSYAYDKAGNVVTVTDSLSRITGYEYDRSGNLTKVTDPKGNEISYTYDALGRMVSAKHEDGSEDLFAYDPAGNLTASKEGGIRITEYTYDEMDRCTGIKDALGNETAYKYDLCGNLAEETAPDESLTAYTYDEMNRLISRKLPNEGAYTYAYDKAGRITKVCGPTGLTASYRYDQTGNLTALIKGGTGQKEIQRTDYRYDCLNRIVEITDAIGGKTGYTYDEAGNITKMTCADGAAYEYAYDKTGKVTRTTDPAGLMREYIYDTEGQLLSETSGTATAETTANTAGGAASHTAGTAENAAKPAETAAEPDGEAAFPEPDGQRTYTYSYDKAGNLTAVTDPLAGKTAYAYDERNRMTKTVSPKGTATAYAYDSLGNLTSLTDGEGNTTTYAYDAKGRLTEKTTAESTGDLTPREQTTTYTYDSRDRLTGVAEEDSLVTYTYNTVGNLTSVTDANGNTTQYDYDRAGNLTQTLDPLGNRKQYGYDEAGRLAESTDENGNTTRYDYDALNRLVKKDTGETLSTASYAYDAMGRLTLMDDVTEESLYTYDHAGRLLTATDGNGKQITYAYDIYGNITEVTYPDGRKAAYTYDALDRMTGVTTPEGKTTRYEYDADGNMTKAVREDGETNITYDRRGQVKALANTKDGQIISVYAYAYDGRGNITREETRILKEGKLTETSAHYTYDGKSQLIKAETREEGQSPATTTYTYDPAGNRLKMETEKGGKTLTVTYTYDEGGRLTRAEDSEGGVTAYEYDRAGNLITEKGDAVTATDTVTAGHTITERHYLYDASDRLTAVTDKDTLLLAALYDGSDNRTFTMEYAPELKAGTDAGTGGKTPETEKADAPEAGSRDKSPRNDSVISQNGTGGETGDINEHGRQEETGGGNTGGTSTEKASGAKAFWYGILCQTADILLPAPTPFKAWLHEKMGFTDDVSALWTKEPCEAETGGSTLTVREAGSPFALMEDIFADTTQTELSAETYRQVNYVNDINRANAQVLMEYATNGSMGTSTTAYGYGIRRESCSMTETAQTAGNVMESVTTQTSMTYCYTGTGSVANLISSTGNRSYTYTPNGQMSEYAMDSPDRGSMADIGNNSSHGTYGAYGYNGEYTHTDLGLQYLRARYYNMTTGTFTSKDTYGGTLTDILSQNRYTYAENNPVTYADPSGHAAKKGAMASVFNKIKTAVTNITNKLTSKNHAGNTTPADIMNKNAVSKLREQSDRSGKKPSLLENIRIYNGIHYYSHIVADLPITTLMSSSGGGLAWEESLAAKVEARKCLAYDNCVNEEQEKIKYSNFNAIDVYAVPGTMYNPLPVEQQIANAEYIYNYLHERGWSLKAICGLLGNINRESYYNPGMWEEKNNIEQGYGIVQWTKAEEKFLPWFNEKSGGEYATGEEIKNAVNEMAIHSPKKLMDYELEYLLLTCESSKGEWIPEFATLYGSPEVMEFETYIKVSEDDEISVGDMALIFHGTYERSRDTEEIRKTRKEWAEYWYDYFMGRGDIRKCF